MLQEVPLSFISGFLFKMKHVRRASATWPLSSFGFHFVVDCTCSCIKGTCSYFKLIKMFGLLNDLMKVK